MLLCIAPILKAVCILWAAAKVEVSLKKCTTVTKVRITVGK